MLRIRFPLIAALLLAAGILTQAIGCYSTETAKPQSKADAIVGPIIANPDVQLRMSGAAGTFYLDIYQLGVPMGAVSRNDDFWRHLDEEHFDPAMNDLLLKNGVRTGIGSTSDWDYFKDQIEQNPHFARSGSAVATGTGLIELPMKKNVPSQDLFFLTDKGVLRGRTYEFCDNLFGVSFWPDPRRPGEMRLSISPTVRSTRTRLEFNLRNEQREFVEVTPEYIYELNLRTIISKDRFFVMALSPEGRWPTSLGHQFLTLDGGAEKREQVLLFVPRLPSRKAPTTSRSEPNIDARIPGR